MKIKYFRLIGLFVMLIGCISKKEYNRSIKYEYVYELMNCEEKNYYPKRQMNDCFGSVRRKFYLQDNKLMKSIHFAEDVRFRKVTDSTIYFYKNDVLDKTISYNIEYTSSQDAFISRIDTLSYCTVKTEGKSKFNKSNDLKTFDMSFQDDDYSILYRELMYLQILDTTIISEHFRDTKKMLKYSKNMLISFHTLKACHYSSVDFRFFNCEPTDSANYFISGKRIDSMKVYTEKFILQTNIKYDKENRVSEKNISKRYKNNELDFLSKYIYFYDTLNTKRELE